MGINERLRLEFLHLAALGSLRSTDTAHYVLLRTKTRSEERGLCYSSTV